MCRTDPDIGDESGTAFLFAPGAEDNALVHIEDAVVVQTVDLHLYDAFLCGKAGAAV